MTERASLMTSNGWRVLPLFRKKRMQWLSAVLGEKVMRFLCGNALEGIWVPSFLWESLSLSTFIVWFQFPVPLPWSPSISEKCAPSLWTSLLSICLYSRQVSVDLLLYVNTPPPTLPIRSSSGPRKIWGPQLCVAVRLPPPLVPAFPQSCPDTMPSSLGNMFGTSGWVSFGAPLMAGGCWVAGHLGRETKWCHLPLERTPTCSTEPGRTVAFSTQTLSNVVSSYGNPGDSFHPRVLFQMEC